MASKETGQIECKDRLDKFEKDGLRCLCKSPKRKDLSQGIGETRHYYAECCGAHIYNGKRYSKIEWERYINGTKNPEAQIS